MLTGIMQTYADGAEIFRQGDSAADMYVVRAGKVRIVREGDSGPIELAVLAQGESFGEMGLFSPGPRSATAIALGQTEVETIDVATFKSAVPEPIVWRMLARMSERIRLADEILDASNALDHEPLIT